MKNDYKVEGDVTTIFVNSPKNGYFEVIVDTDDLERIKKLNSVRISPGKKRGSYAMTSVETKEGLKDIFLHRFVMGVYESNESNKFIDHINHNTLDNRKSKLRVVTAAENGQNRRKQNKNNKSGVTGVQWIESRKRWQARIKVNRKLKHLGFFKDFEKAKKARAEGEIKYFTYKQTIKLKEVTK